MKPITRILILCDAHDLLRHEGTNLLLLKQLYTAIFLLKKHFAKQHYTLHLNNRGLINFESFWPCGHELSTFLNSHIIQKDWKTIDMSAYDLIIVHPHYQEELQQHFLRTYGFDNESGIYSFSELQFPCTMRYKIVAGLFGKQGLFAFNRNTTNEKQLAAFKKNFDDSVQHINADGQERKIPQLDQLIKTINGRFELEKSKNILILDDFNRPFFIGDSVYWLAKIKKLMTLFPKSSKHCLNINNENVFKSVSKIFKQSISDQITITNQHWETLSFEEYDLVLCNNDILLKFHWFITNKNLLDKLNLYSFSVMDERSVSGKVTMDFYTNILNNNKHLDQTASKINANIINEISLQPEEHTWAKHWLLNKGIQDSDHLIILLHDASNQDKVIYDLTLLKLIRKFSALSENIKILLVTEKEISANTWLNEITTKSDCQNVVLADALSLREVMRLFTDQKIKAVIGPCTGLMHLADGVYAHLYHQKLISEVPLLLTYAGKQSKERMYHPNHWWKEPNFVCCAVHMHYANDINNKQLLLLKDCPPDFEEFNRQSIPARALDADLLLSFISEKFPEFIHQYKSNDNTNALINIPDLPQVQVKIPTFIISLEHRTERRQHILKQFANQPAFDCTLVNAIENENGRLGLWYTIKKIINENAASDHDYILICEDDHQFTADYSEQQLFTSISNAKTLNADILLGGICFCDNQIKKIHDSLLAVDHFACMQFVIIFRSFFECIRTAEFLEHDCADLKIANLSSKKLAIYPFISTQKDFGYSDVSDGYYENKMSIYFEETSKLIEKRIK